MATGAAGALAFEPYRVFPLLLLSYAGFVLLLDGASAGPKKSRTAFWIGWSYGFGFFLVGLYWIGYAFLVDAQEHAWQLPFVAVLVPGGLALFFGLGALLCVLLWRPGVQRIFAFAAIFAVIEYLRGHVLTGFPWNLPAYGWAASPAVLQSASVFGAYGLSLLTLLFGASFAVFGRWHNRRERLLPILMTVVFVGFWADGEARLLTADNTTIPGVRIRIVQPDTPEPEKYDPRLMVRNWARLVDLSTAPAAQPPTIIVWPEAASMPAVGILSSPTVPPFPAARVPTALSDIAKITARGAVLMTGTVRIEQTSGAPKSYNSFAMFGAGGKLIAGSDKFHLVPFGEYLPFENAMRAIGITEVAASTGFSSGTGPQTFSVPGAPPVTPLICYEIIFPQAVTGTPRPSWLVNMTDDSWFGPNAGPKQHLLIAQVRAIEEGLPIARAANSGISVMIDGYGRIRSRLDLGLRGFLDAGLPVALPVTPFARYGNFILLTLLLLCGGATLWPQPRIET
ncbi:MAG TPA: apolipoprotein N-acyltransferase [Micropepsaceae bacterium]|nr:apolipoprotein N-acyltransferase [Micropepsaceae bacterium]